jgi:hypothetical protein
VIDYVEELRGGDVVVEAVIVVVARVVCVDQLQV